VAQKFHFAMLRIEVTRASRGLSAIALRWRRGVAVTSVGRINEVTLRWIRPG